MMDDDWDDLKPTKLAGISYVLLAVGFLVAVATVGYGLGTLLLGLW